MGKKVSPIDLVNVLPQHRRLGVIHSEEQLHQFKDEFLKYFWRVATHFNYPEVEQNTMVIYRGGVILRNRRVKEVIIRAPRDMEIPYPFVSYESSGGFSLTPDTVIYLLVESTQRIFPIAYYRRRENILVTSDWTHDDGCIALLQALWPKIVKILELKRAIRPRLKKERLKKQKITIGADPEFELLSSGSVYRACRVIDDDSCRSPIGVDGAGDQMELRPEPGSPARVVRSIRQLLWRFRSMHRNYSVSTLGNTYPLGGHIHVGFERTGNYGMNGFYNNYRNKYSQFVSVLDDFLGSRVRSLNGEAREHDGYGSLGDFELKDYGFEYRTPPSQIFAHPTLCRICLKIVRNLAAALTYREIEYDNPPSLKDYVEVGGLTEREAEMFLNPSERMLSTDVLSNWGVRRRSTEKPPQPSVFIQFHEDWPDELREVILSKLDHLIQRDTLKAITFIGLREERGRVSNIPMVACSITHDVPFITYDGSHLRVGVPKYLREHEGAHNVGLIMSNNVLSYIKSLGV